MQFLFDAARYKILYGGRGGAKSWGIARALLVLGAMDPLRVLCAREIQKSIQESVHQLLKDQIDALGLNEFYEVLQTEIRGRNGTLFIFAGLKHNVDNIKSKEGIDIAWVEEAANVSKTSWDKLIPTIRKPGSEIWVSFNPELDSDETYKRFVLSPPTGAKVEKLNWSDNPWFPEVLQQEMEDLKQRDHDAYLTVWEGHCKQVLDGAIYANEIRAATEQGRIGRVPYVPGVPVHTFWDLGRADKTSIWFIQVVGFEFRVVDYYENRGYALDHYLGILQGRGYVYGEDHLPHDAQNEQLGAKRTIEQQMRDIGRKVSIVPKIGVADGINAARTVFGRCWFDEEKTADGLTCLRRYRYDVDPDTQQYSKNPLHDEASHGADAFRYFAVAMEEPKTAKKKKAALVRAGGWMGA
ncbi:PBSX family phage terminase large subunit [Agaricicola taiwanensis]|nr:PBSX family phage terminase large subunit [Agaricicola taiwanensis]